MRLGDVASSVSGQVGAVDDALRSSAYGLRLGGLQLTVKGAATSLDNDVALAFIRAEPDEIIIEHYAFLVSEGEFDQIFWRIKERGLQYWADPGHGIRA